MLRQSSSRSHRSKRLRPTNHSLQAVLLVAVGIWIVYQLTHSYGKRRAVVVETDDGSDREPARRRLGRKSFIDFAGGQASVDDIVWVSGRSDAGSEGVQGVGSSSDPLSKAGDGEGGDGDEEDQEANEDDGVDSDTDDGLAADDEEDDRDFQPQNGNGEDESKTARLRDETDRASAFGNGRLHKPSELNSSTVPPANATGGVQDGVAVLQTNATDAADGVAMALSDDSAAKNTSSVNVSLHDRGRAGDGAETLLVNGLAAVGTPGAENEKLINNAFAAGNQMTNQNGTAVRDSDTAIEHGIWN